MVLHRTPMTQRTSLSAFAHPYRQSLADTPYSVPGSSAELSFSAAQRGRQRGRDVHHAAPTGELDQPPDSPPARWRQHILIVYLRSQRKRSSYEIAAKG